MVSAFLVLSPNVCSDFSQFVQYFLYFCICSKKYYTICFAWQRCVKYQSRLAFFQCDHVKRLNSAMMCSALCSARKPLDIVNVPSYSMRGETYCTIPTMIKLIKYFSVKYCPLILYCYRYIVNLYCNPLLYATPHVAGKQTSRVPTQTAIVHQTL